MLSFQNCSNGKLNFSVNSSGDLIASKPINARKISTSILNTCAILADGLYCWGSNAYGEAGNGTPGPLDQPTKVTQLPTAPSKVVTAGVYTSGTPASSGAFTCVILNRAVKCWGKNNDGMLGNNSTLDSLGPVDAIGLDADVTDIEASSNFVCAIKSGDVFCWGNNSYGQLGNNTTGAATRVPTKVLGLSLAATKVSTGYSHTCAKRRN